MGFEMKWKQRDANYITCDPYSISKAKTISGHKYCGWVKLNGEWEMVEKSMGTLAQAKTACEEHARKAA